MRKFLFTVLVIQGCIRASGGAVDRETREPWRGPGVITVATAGANVRVEGGALRVDAADGSRWFDVRWVDAPPGPADEPARAWAHDVCTGVRFDAVGTPAPGATFLSGNCTIDGRRHWMFTVTEQRTDPSKVLLTTWLGQMDRLTLEDAWVDFVSTALRTTGGSEPLAVPEPAALRQIARSAPPMTGGDLPVPGGGRLTGHWADALRPVFTARSEGAQPLIMTVQGDGTPADLPR
jgi:hypothetical protein